MVVKCPVLSAEAIVSDDAQLAASLSSALARRGRYLPVLDGPRLTRPDRGSEIIRRVATIAHAGTKSTLLAGLSAEACDAIINKLPQYHAKVVGFGDVAGLSVDPDRAERPRLIWGRDRIGLGLLTALYSGQLIEFADKESLRDPLPSKSGHLVICEAHEPLSEVIAANYAYALNAGLHIFDETDEVEGKALLEALYSIDAPGVSAAAERARVSARMRELVGALDLPAKGSLTFIVRQLPLGVAFPELPGTHLFTYPDLGRAVVNGFAAEQPGSRGTNVAVLVNPQKVAAPEIEAAAKLLPKRQIFVRSYEGLGASVRGVSEMVDLFPYDLLLFATHCGDASGHRWTYEYRDSEGIDRKLVVDVAIGVGHTDDEDILRVMRYNRFHSLDGVDWSDPVAKADLYVGSAIRDWSERARDNAFEPVHREPLDRVLGSAVLAMADDNYLPMPRALACEGSPIIFNNACVSWHELAGRFMFANARAYIGTLYPVSDIEAEAVAVELIGKQFGKMLPHALWSAQNSVYGEGSDRRPYVVSGVYPQLLRSTREDVPRRIISRLWSAMRYWKRRAAEVGEDEPERKEEFDEIANYYTREFSRFQNRWFRHPHNYNRY
jgi:hypothetical protein